MDHLGATNDFSRRAPNMMTSKIKQALDFMRNQGLEVRYSTNFMLFTTLLGLETYSFSIVWKSKVCIKKAKEVSIP